MGNGIIRNSVGRGLPFWARVTKLPLELLAATAAYAKRPALLRTDRQLEINDAVREADQVKGGGIERCATRRQRAPHGPTRPTRLELKPRTRSRSRLKEKRTALVRSDVSESRAHLRRPDVLPAAIVFAFRTVCRLHNGCKRRRRRGPEGVAHSTWFTPHRVFRTASGAFAMARQDPVPLLVQAGAECRSAGGVVGGCLMRPTLEARCWLARAVETSLLSPFLPPLTPDFSSSLPRQSFFLLQTHSLALVHHDGTATVAHL